MKRIYRAMKKLLPIFLLLLSTVAYAQSTSYKIEGVLKSKSDSISLESATIHLEKVKDSSVVSYTITDKDGKFTLEGKTFEKELRLVASFVGYKSYTQKIVFNKSNFQLGNIELDFANVLDEVVLKASRSDRKCKLWY